MTTRPQRSDGAFDHARELLDEARTTLGEMVAAWDALREEQPFASHAEPAAGTHRQVVVTCTPSAAAQGQLERAATAFALAVKRAMDEAVFAAADSVSGGLFKVGLHRMPLVRTPAAFDALTGSRGHLMGLRPDQVDTLRTLQPFIAGSPARAEIGRLMQTLLNLLEAPSSSERVSIWVSDSHPQIRVNGVVKNLKPDSLPGMRLPIGGQATITGFDLPDALATDFVDVNPNAALDAIFDVEPWPLDRDDNATRRARGLLRAARALIDGLERSVTVPALIRNATKIDDLLPAHAESAWLPVAFEFRTEEEEVRAGLRKSDLGIASYRDDKGRLVLLTLENGRVVGREVPEARVPVPEGPLGPGVEHASLAAAASWGLPDFVYRPRVLRKGSGIREVGDGTIITGGKGIALQVKAREGPTDNPDRETAWLKKKAQQAARQAHGTIRTALRVTDLRLHNLRGRETVIDGTRVEWLPVVVLDHPDPPHDLKVQTNLDEGVVLLRRDWEFLWNQLRSASAVVDYLHRVSGSTPPTLGGEATRYMELVVADEEAEPAPPPKWMSSFFASQPGGPLLPRDLASAADAPAHAVFNEILNDIAETDFTGDESTRLHVLAQLDRVPVGQRAELGRLLLATLDACLLAAPTTVITHHRTMMIDEGRLHLAFSVFSNLTGYLQAVFEDWLLLRRQQLLEARGGEASEVWTIGVLLTPRPDGVRLWDTTVLATQGQPEFDPAHRTRLERLWPIGGDRHS